MVQSHVLGKITMIMVFALFLVFSCHLHASEFTRVVFSPSDQAVDRCFQQLDKVFWRFGAAYFNSRPDNQVNFNVIVREELDSLYDVINSNARHIDPMSNKGRACFCAVSRVADRRTLACFIDKGFDPSFKRDKRSYSAVEYASYWGNCEALEFFRDRDVALTTKGFDDIMDIAARVRLGYTRGALSCADVAPLLPGYFTARAISYVRNFGSVDAHARCLEIIKDGQKMQRDKKRRAFLASIKKAFGLDNRVANN